MKLFLISLFLLVISPLFGQNLHIIGNVKGDYYNNNLQGIKVVASNPENDEVFKITYTDVDGNYSFNFLFTNIDVQSESKITQPFPNPSSNKTQFNINSTSGGYFELKIYDSYGHILLVQDLNLGKGLNQLTVYNGATGIFLLNLENGNENYSAKWVCVTTSGVFSAETKTLHTGLNKSSQEQLLSADSLRLVFTDPPGGVEYIGADTTIAMDPDVQQYQADMVLTQIPTSDDYLIRAFNVISSEKAVDGTKLKVTWGDGTTNIYSSNNGLIHILRTNTYDTIQNILIENPDTTNYAEFLVGVKTDPLITTKELNLFQTTLDPNVYDPNVYNAPPPAIAFRNQLTDTIDVYFVPNIVHAGNNRSYNIRDRYKISPFIKCRVNALTRKWEQGQFDTTYIFQMQKYNESGEPISEYESELQDSILLIVMNNLLKVGERELMPLHKIVKIYTETEPEWLLAWERGPAPGMDQVYLCRFGNDEYNGGTFSQDSTFSDFSRMKVAIAEYYGFANLSKTIIATEMTQAFVINKDPPGESAQFIGNPETGLYETSRLLRLMLIANPGSILW